MPAGMSSAFDKPLPPYIEFKKEAMERRDAAGNVLYIDVNMAYITPPGGKDTMVKIADDWFPYIKKMSKEGQYPPLWYDQFLKQYEAWKAGEEIPVDGTHVKNWPSVSPAEAKVLTDLRIMTVEQVAAMNEEATNRVGMGGRSLRQRAIDYLAAQKDIAPVVAKIDALVAQVSRMQLELDKKNGTIASLESQLKARGAVVEHAEPQLRPLEDRLEEARAFAARSERKDDALVGDILNEELA